MKLTYIVDKPEFKVVECGKYIFLASKLDFVVREFKGRKTAVQLGGIGNTGTGASGQPWLITLTNTRTSYIFLKDEHVAVSYVAERLNFYDSEDAITVANVIQQIVRAV